MHSCGDGRCCPDCGKYVLYRTKLTNMITWGHFVVVPSPVILVVVVHRKCFTTCWTNVGLTNHCIAGHMPVVMVDVVKMCRFVESTWSAGFRINMGLMLRLAAPWHVVLALVAVPILQFVKSVYFTRLWSSGAHAWCQWYCSLWFWLLLSVVSTLLFYWDKPFWAHNMDQGYAAMWEWLLPKSSCLSKVSCQTDLCAWQFWHALVVLWHVILVVVVQGMCLSFIFMTILDFYID